VFDDRSALDDYQVHPAHEAVKSYVATVATARAVVDYEV
ncbi:MAG: Dabb family protein, partial [Alkalispirochaeta sp.]